MGSSAAPIGGGEAGGPLDPAEQVFKQLDKSGDGQLSGDELRQMALMLGQTDWDSLASAADVDGDAQVSMAEFKPMFAQMLKGATDSKGSSSKQKRRKKGKGDAQRADL